MKRPLHEIAQEIDSLWRDNSGKPAKARWCAEPYLQALGALNTIDDRYGLDSAQSVVLYFLSNAAQFRGEDARRIKNELKQIAGIK